MSRPSAVDAARADLFTPEAELRQKYSDGTTARLLRLRELYAWLLANPDAKDRAFVDVAQDRFGIVRSCAYADLAIIKTLLPNLAEASRDFHRWRYNEMILETYQMAKKRKDTKTMERAATSYAKYNRIDLEDEAAVPYDEIVVQPFTATSDPTVLGIKPLPNLQERIDEMIRKYRAETADIEDVEFEVVDLEEDALFPVETSDAEPDL